MCSNGPHLMLRIAMQPNNNNNNNIFISATLHSDSAVQCHLTAWLFCEGGGAWFLYFFVLHSVIFVIPSGLSTGVKKIIIMGPTWSGGGKPGRYKAVAGNFCVRGLDSKMLRIFTTTLAQNGSSCGGRRPTSIVHNFLIGFVKTSQCLGLGYCCCLSLYILFLIHFSICIHFNLSRFGLSTWIKDLIDWFIVTRSLCTHGKRLGPRTLASSVSACFYRATLFAVVMCLSVCLSQADIVSKRLDQSGWFCGM